MKIEKKALAGTLESSDLLVKVEPNQVLEIFITSDVMKQFGRHIHKVVAKTLNDLDITEGLIIIEDKGALDCVIKARVQCAVLRSICNAEISWEKLI